MNLLFVTNNKWKVREISEVLKEFDISLEQRQKEIPEKELNSIEKIAIDKAKRAFKEFREPLIVEDTGLYFKAYKDFPGTHPKRVFLGIGFDGIFRLLKGKDPNAFFKSVIVFIDSPTNYKVFSGEMRGKIIQKVKKPKADVMPYDKIFVPKGEKETIAEMPLEKKNSFSQRAIAARKLGKFLKGKELDYIVESLD